VYRRRPRQVNELHVRMLSPTNEALALLPPASSSVDVPARAPTAAVLDIVVDRRRRCHSRTRAINRAVTTWQIRYYWTLESMKGLLHNHKCTASSALNIASSVDSATCPLAPPPSLIPPPIVLQAGAIPERTGCCQHGGPDDIRQTCSKLRVTRQTSTFSAFFLL
jgi:hypothetical protein